MKFLKISATAVLLMASSVNANALCDTWFNGPVSCAGEQNFKDYWGCRSILASGWVLCKSVLPVVGSKLDQAKLDLAENTCKGPDQVKCQEALKDVADDMRTIEGINLNRLGEQVKEQLDKEIEAGKF